MIKLSLPRPKTKEKNLPENKSSYFRSLSSRRKQGRGKEARTRAIFS